MCTHLDIAENKQKIKRMKQVWSVALRLLAESSSCFCLRCCDRCFLMKNGTDASFQRETQPKEMNEEVSNL